MEKLKELLMRYMQSWVLQDKNMFLDTLSDEIDIRECYGASYATKAQEQWFLEWNRKGKVLVWDMEETFYVPDKELLIATWEFHYDFPDSLPDRFDGITVMSAKNGRIKMLHEYQTNHARFYPYA